MSKSLSAMSRIELLNLRTEHEEKLGRVRTQLGAARRTAKVQQEYMNHVEYNALRAQEAAALGMIRTVTVYLRNLAATADNRTPSENNFNAAFYKAAHEMFDPEDLEDVIKRTKEIFNG